MKTKLKDIYQTKTLSFVERNPDWMYLNAACQTALSTQAKEAADYYERSIGVCASRGENELSNTLDSLIGETRETILSNLGLNQDDWDVVFMNNATACLNTASWLIADYVNKIDSCFYVYCSPFAHNSLYLPSVKITKHYHRSSWQEFDINDLSIVNGKDNNVVPEILFIPYIDNLFGFSHFDQYLDGQSNHRFKGIRKNYRHIILDATQGALSLLNPNNKAKKSSLETCSAICFSGHKAHSQHLGILVIRKMYLKANLLDAKGMNVGGGTLSRFDGNRPVFQEDNRLLEAGLVNAGSILGFGAFNHFISQSSTDYSQELATALNKLHMFMNESGTQPYLSKLSISKYLKIKIYKNNSILLIKNEGFVIDDLYSRLSYSGIDVRKNNFCCDYAFNKYNIPDCIRLSFDWTACLDKTIIPKVAVALSLINQDYTNIVFDQKDRNR